MIEQYGIRKLFPLISLLALVLAACNAATPQPTPIPTPIPSSIPSSIPSAIPTPLPSSVSTPMATAAPTASATPAPTAAPTATAAPAASTARLSAGTQATNCRFGPGTDFLTVGGLPVGQSMPILGSFTGQGWWQIDNPSAPGSPCWVSAAVTTTSGDLSTVPIVPAPGGQVTSVSVSSPVDVHGICGNVNYTVFKVTITTNGPAEVIYHLEMYNADGTLRDQTADAALAFANASSQTITPLSEYGTDCGSFQVKAVVTSPNGFLGQAFWSVVSP